MIKIAISILIGVVWGTGIALLLVCHFLRKSYRRYITLPSGIKFPKDFFPQKTRLDKSLRHSEVIFDPEAGMVRSLEAGPDLYAGENYPKNFEPHEPDFPVAPRTDTPVTPKSRNS